MMRFGTPVFDEKGDKQGIVMLNYLGARLIRRNKFASLESPGEIMLVNANGFWLSAPRESDEWGFMFADRKARNFGTDFPDEWQKIASSWEAQIHTDQGLFTTTTIYPVMENFKPAPVTSNPNGPDGAGKTESYPWKLISHIPSEQLHITTRGLLIKLTFSAIVLFLVAAIPSLLISRAIVKRRLQQAALHRSANYDKLTNLPNRSFFIDRLSQVFMQSKRYERKFS